MVGGPAGRQFRKYLLEAIPPLAPCDGVVCLVSKFPFLGQYTAKRLSVPSPTQRLNSSLYLIST